MRRERTRVFVNQSNLTIRRMGDINDVSLALLEDGSLLIYNATTEKFEASKTTNKFTAGNINFSGSTITSTANNQNLTFILAGNSNISVSNSRIIDLQEPVDSSDATTKNYVDNTIDERFNVLTANNFLTFSGDTGSDTLFLSSETLNFAGGQGVITEASNNSVTIDLENTGVTSGEYGSPTLTAVFNVNEKGQITSVYEVPSLAFLNIDTDEGSEFVTLLTEALAIEGGTGVTTSITPSRSIRIDIGQDVSTSADVEFNNVTVNGTLNSDDITATTVEVFGNLTVHGTTTTINTEEVLIADNIIILNSNLDGSESPSQDAGLTVNRGIESEASLLWDETEDRWTVGGYSFAAQEFVGLVNGGSY